VVLGVVGLTTEITIAMESKMKYTLMVILLSLSTHLYASGDRSTTTTTNTYNYSSVTDARGVAIAIASAQHNFDYGTYSWQGSVGAGYYNGEDAVSFGVAKRVGKILMNGSITPDSIGVGVNWRF